MTKLTNVQVTGSDLNFLYLDTHSEQCRKCYAEHKMHTFESLCGILFYFTALLFLTAFSIDHVCSLYHLICFLPKVESQMLTGMSIHDLGWFEPLRHIEHREHYTAIGLSSLVYDDTGSVCRNFQSSDIVAPSPNSTTVAGNSITHFNMLST